MNINGSNRTNLNMDTGLTNVPVFSPAGSKIAFRSDNSEIFIININGSEQKNLTKRKDIDYNPVFSPDGLKIANMFFAIER